jgi:hypothetical protein
MRIRLGVALTRLGAGVRRFLAQGRPARLAACVVVALAAVIWLGVAIVVLRFVSVLIVLLAALWCAWLVAATWWAPVDKAASGSPLRLLPARLRLAFRVLAADSPSAQGARGLAEPEQAALAAFRRSADELTGELLRRQGRLNADTERLQRELAGQIETMRALVARIGQFEQQVSRLAGERESTSRDSGPLVADDLTADPDLQAAFDELEADLRLEKIEEREQMLGEREKRLDRRERELAAFVADAQNRLS